MVTTDAAHPQPGAAAVESTDPQRAGDAARVAVAEGSGPPVVARVTLIADRGTWPDEKVSFLGAEGFAVWVDPGGDSAFDHRASAADAAIIDLGLSGRPAASVCVAWRRRSPAPILAVTAVGSEAAVLAAFDLGVDSVVRRDASSRQLVAHLRSLLRRFPPRRASLEQASAPSVVRLGVDGRSALVGGREVRLTVDEFQLLALLLDRGGRVVTRADLASALGHATGSARTVDFLVRRLRSKLEAADTRRRIAAVRGVGFRLDVSDRDGPAAHRGRQDGEVR